MQAAKVCVRAPQLTQAHALARDAELLVARGRPKQAAETHAAAARE